jgi:hypothetical protein
LGGLSLGVTSTAGAGSLISIDILDANDPGGPAPSSLVVVDLAIDVRSDLSFGGVDVRAGAGNGATLVYSSVQWDEVFFPPGSGNPFVTFGSAPYPRDAIVRFSPAGTPEEPSIRRFGATHPIPVFAPTILDVAYIPDPYSPPDLLDRDGYFLRVALNITGVQIEGGQDAANYRIFTLGDEPPGFLPVFVGRTIAGFDPAGSAGMDWGVYVPEPGTAGVMLLGTLLLIGISRRARQRCSTGLNSAGCAWLIVVFCSTMPHTSSAQPTIGAQARIDVGSGLDVTDGTAVACSHR